MFLKKALLLAAAMAVVFGAAACGVKTHPWPEMVTLPGPVRGLSQRLDFDGRLLLSWLPPETNIAGRPLQTLDHFEVWGADYSAVDYCEGCPVGFVKFADVFIQAPPPGMELAPGPYVWETRLRPGRVYVFRVAGFSPRGAVNSQAWVRTTVWNLPAPPALSGFTTVADDLSVRLLWSPPSEGTVVEVQRREGQGSFVTLDPVRDVRVDTAVAYGRHYVYRARTVLVKGETRIPGPWTNDSEVTIEDLLPPPPPSFLDAALTPAGVSLAWENLQERGDVAGYRIYRRPAEEAAFSVIAEVTSGSTYLDLPPVAGADYVYRVTAFDTSPRANESSPSPESRVYAEPIGEPVTPLQRPELPDPGI
jgi:hypothetical protein